MYGKDGKWYKNDHDGLNDMWAANSRWNQQERQNKLLQEQNRLQKERNKLMKNQQRQNKNYDNDGISSSQIFVSEILNKFHSESKGKISRQNALKLADKKSSIIMHASFMIIVIPLCLTGFVDVIIDTILKIFGIWINFNSDAMIGKSLLAVYIVYFIYLVVSYFDLKGKTMKKSKSRVRIS